MRFHLRIVSVLAVMLTSALAGPGAYAAFRVALVDRFYPGDYALPKAMEQDLLNSLYGMVDLDRDRSREPLYHGDVVEMLLAHPDIQVLRYPLPGDRTPMQGILQQLRKVHDDARDHPIDAVLLPWESSTLISSLEPRTTLDNPRPLRAEAVERYVETVRAWGEDSEVWAVTHDIIRALEALSATGMKVYTIAGNGGRGMVNTFSFANDVTTVGASERELANFVSNNAFVDEREQAAYLFRRVDGSDGAPLGYDLDDDGCPEVSLRHLTGYSESRRDYPREGWRALKGSSFAAPRALRRFLVGAAPPSFCVSPVGS
ncbi:MAG: hypothetical protein ACPGU7_12365 [Gammaproteobacteria bacterium]